MGGDDILYIVGYEEYKNYLKTGIYKYFPEFLLPSLKPKILEEILCRDKVIGNIAGINLKNVDFSDEKRLEEYVLSIIKIKSPEDNILLFKDYKDMEISLLKEIEIKTSMKIPTGKNILRYNLPLIIDEFFNCLGEDIYNQELLLICDEKEDSIDSIRALSKSIKYITLIGSKEDNKEEIYSRALSDTGLSIFQPENIDKKIGSYDIIINLSNELRITLNGIKRKTLVIDFSEEKIFKAAQNNKISHMIIEDLSFKTSDLNIMESPWIDNNISSRIIEGFGYKENEKFYKIITGNGAYFTDDFISTYIKNSGRI